jgi:hypothetical protein
MRITERTKQQAAKAIAAGYKQVFAVKAGNHGNVAVLKADLKSVKNAKVGTEFFGGNRGFWLHGEERKNKRPANAIQYQYMMQL